MGKWRKGDILVGIPPVNPKNTLRFEEYKYRTGFKATIITHDFYKKGDRAIEWAIKCWELHPWAKFYERIHR